MDIKRPHLNPLKASALFFFVAMSPSHAAAQSKLPMVDSTLTPSLKDIEAEIDSVAELSSKPRPRLLGETFDAYVLPPFGKEVRRVKMRVNNLNQAVMEGDMIVGAVSEVEAWSDNWAGVLKLAEASGISPSVAMDDTQHRWPGGIVPYQVTGDFDKATSSEIDAAIEQLNADTNVRFIPYVRGVHKDYVDVVVLPDDELGSGQASLGRTGKRQFVRLAQGARSHLVIHEMMHTLGFQHEHTRADRDDFVTIRWSNIREDAKFAFRKSDSSVLIGDYDIESVMHYDGFTFSKSCNLTQLAAGQACGVCANLIEHEEKNGQCRPAIVHKKNGDPVNDSDRFSAADIAAVNALYPEEEEGESLPAVDELRSLRVTVERVVTLVGPNESGVCGAKTDYLTQLKAGPALSLADRYDNVFDEKNTSVWETRKPERSNDFRPNWRLVSPINPGTSMMRVDAYVYDHDDALCGGKNDIIDVSPNRGSFLRLLIDTENGDWFLLSTETHPITSVQSFPSRNGRGGNIFNSSSSKYRSLTFNGLLDGDAPHNDEAKLEVKIEIL